MTGAKVDAPARTEIDRRVQGARFVHSTGHGLGLAYHEAVPLSAPGAAMPLVAGMMTSVEPGLYEQRVGGMRLEENVMFTDTGVELPAGVPFDLVCYLDLPRSGPSAPLLQVEGHGPDW